jgi:DNA-binding NtrC family response regulator
LFVFFNERKHSAPIICISFLLYSKWYQNCPIAKACFFILLNHFLQIITIRNHKAMSLKKITSLIIEDDEHFAGTFQKQLEKLGITKIEWTKDVREGLKMTSKMQPTIVFLDNSLHNIDGSEVIKLYKSVSLDTLIILMSSQFSMDQVALCIQNGADYLFSKNNIDEAGLKKLLKASQKSKEQKKSIWDILSFKKEKKKKTKNIAIVEDDEVFSFYLNWYLKRSENKPDITIFDKAHSFYDSYTQSSPDIIFLDYTLPDGNGMEIMEFIKVKHPKASVIMMTAQDDVEVAIELKSLGIKNYIIKNINWQKTLEKIVIDLQL